VTEHLARIDQRVLVVFGQRDAIAVAGAPRFEALRNVEFAVLPSIGHEIFADAHEQALERVTAFLDHQYGD